MSSVQSDIQFRIRAQDESASTFLKARQNIEGVNGAFETLKRVAEAAFVGLSITSVTEKFLAINEQIDQMGKSAQKIGIPVQQLSKLEYAAKLANVPLDTLQVSLEKFDKGLVQAASGGGGNVAKTLAAMGIAATDANGKMRDQVSILKEAADKFASYQDGAAKTNLAIGLLNKNGAEMIPWLNLGSAGIDSASSQLEKFGGVLTDDAVAASEKFNDNLVMIGTAINSMEVRMVELLAGPLAQLSDSLVHLLEDGTAVNHMFETMASDMEFVARNIGPIVAGFSMVKSVNDAIFTTLTPGTPQRLFDSWKNVYNAVTQTVEESKKALAAVNSLQQSYVNGKGSLGAIANDNKGAAPLVDLGGNITRHKAAIDPLTQDATRIFEATRTPLEQYNEQLDRLNVLLDAGKISQDTYNRAVSQSVTDYVSAAANLDKYSSVIQKTSPYVKALDSAFQSWISDAIDGTFNLSSALSDLLKSFAKISANSIFQELMNGNGGNPLYGGGTTGISGFLGSIFGGLFGGARAGGGSVSGGTSYLVGEKGPEIFTPGAAGNITPNHALGKSSGGDVNITIDARGADAGQISQLRADMHKLAKNLRKTTLGFVTTEKAANMGFAT